MAPLTLAERRAAAERIIRASPWVSLAALVVVIATIFANKLFPLALIASPPLGLGLYAAGIWSWKTGKAWLPLVATAPFPILGGQSAMAGGFFGVFHKAWRWPFSSPWCCFGYQDRQFWHGYMPQTSSDGCPACVRRWKTRRGIGVIRFQARCAGSGAWMLLAAIVVYSGLSTAQAADAARPPSVAAKADTASPLLPSPDGNAIRKLLALHQHEELEHLLDQYRIGALWSVSEGEDSLIVAYQSFLRHDSEMLARLDAWVEARPESYQPYVARAFSRVEAGYAARGSKLSNETKPEQFELMGRYMKLAEDDARRAIALQPQNVAPYRVLVLAAGASGASGMLEAAPEALELFPDSYNLHANIIFRLQPKWGGSFDAMTRFAKLAQQHASKNPKLKTLLGYPDWARGEAARLAGRQEEALDHYNKALSWGSEPDFLKGRNRTARHLKQFKLAFDDARRYHQLRPWQEGDSASDDLTKATTNDAWKHTGNAYRAGNLEEAIAGYTLLLEQNPADATALTWRGTSLCRQGNFNPALTDLKAATGLAPKSQEANGNLIACLAYQSRFKEAIAVQEAYLKEVPDDAASLFMLGRLQAQAEVSNNGADAMRKACDLHHADACTFMRSQGLR
ncbi:DUF4034 domain-containing protein [Solimonas sp. SE-A11]|uniref:DUF4034 domain-containing protein n=1 Tax=Solimonas sp. SE-A11 TaxID=3054954 RepID=UPI00259D2DDD|nr:DUF4034 domain-containing protein [Solimonas sp. SE-A11]MDM4772964.1 DUF4034 domain-containing protein [Solimonas sp. SE-A11]